VSSRSTSAAVGRVGLGEAATRALEQSRPAGNEVIFIACLQLRVLLEHARSQPCGHHQELMMTMLSINLQGCYQVRLDGLRANQ
jgi:hypothetical protein